LVINKIGGVFNALAIKAPGFGDRQKEELEDIAIVCGATVISEEVGLKLENAELSHLGKARRVVSTKESTTIIEGAGGKATIKERIDQIKKQIKESDSSWDKEKLEKRLARLAGGVAVIKVGAATEIEQKSKQHKIEDALSATKAAVEEGVVPGGGVALIRAIKSLNVLELKGDEGVGVNILRKALEAPIRQIAENAGVDGGVVVSKVSENSGGFGFNAQEMKYQDLVEAGIVDPKKVVRSALENAVSAAKMFLTTECVVSEKPEKNPPAGGAGMPGGMSGMGIPGMGM